MNYDQILIAQQAAQLLVNNGMSITFMPIAVTQLAHETGGFTSHVFKSNNNLSGIKWINQPYQKNASKGLQSPEGNYYAKFDSLNAWAVDYIRILSLGAQKPINATTLEDFAFRLKQNGYYTDTVQNYTAALNSWYNTIKTIVNDTAQGAAATLSEKKK